LLPSGPLPGPINLANRRKRAGTIQIQQFLGQVWDLLLSLGFAGFLIGPPGKTVKKSDTFAYENRRVH
ncbi:MAG: hypothetical protein OEM03_12630, partial [Chromatiales bacterium]|nr:hypothetical protein [Chromatiales bacterium]